MQPATSVAGHATHRKLPNKPNRPPFGLVRILPGKDREGSLSPAPAGRHRLLPISPNKPNPSGSRQPIPHPVDSQAKVAYILLAGRLPARRLTENGEGTENGYRGEFLGNEIPGL